MKKLYLIFMCVAFSATAMWAETTHYINLSPKVGYSVGLDNFNKLSKDLNTPLPQSNPFGGGGAGLGLDYEIQAGHFIFNIGADFDYQHNMTDYNFDFLRPSVAPYNWDYHYRFLGYRENRQYMHVGLPIRFGAQFGNFYFLLGAKVGYNLKMSYAGFANSAKGYYQVTATDPMQPDVEIGNNPAAGLGVYHIEKGTDGFSGDFTAKPFDAFPAGLDIRALFEAGIDLDQWLQAPVPKKRPNVKPGQRPPFTANDVHYRLGFFAECGGYAQFGATTTNPFTMGEGVEPTAAKSIMTAMPSGVNATLHNLFVGAKFTVQFAIPAKRSKAGGMVGQSVSASKVNIRVLDKETHTLIADGRDSIIIKNLSKNRLLRKSAPKGSIWQQVPRGEYEFVALHPDYYKDSVRYVSDTVGLTDTVRIYLQQRPKLNVMVVNDATGEPIAAKVRIRHKNMEEPIVLVTSANGGSVDTMLVDQDGYILSVNRKGFEPVKIKLSSTGENVVVRLTPKTKKTFVLEDMFFATNKTKILPESEPSLQMLYDYLTDESMKDARVKIIGHTDSVGDDDFNQRLSEGRANAVRQALIDMGIDGDRIEAEGRGEKEPRCPGNDTDECRQQNRRVEVEELQ